MTPTVWGVRQPEMAQLQVKLKHRWWWWACNTFQISKACFTGVSKASLDCMRLQSQYDSMSIHLSQDLQWLFTLFTLFARLSMHFISHLADFCSPVSVFCILVCGGIHSHHQNHQLLLLVALDQPKDDRKKMY